MKCPHCNGNIDVKFVKAPPDMQQSQPSAEVDLETLLDAINAKELDGKASEFVESMREKFEKYGERTRVSDKQMSWLRKLANENRF